MKLSFQNEKFILRADDGDALAFTKDIKQAARFRKYADSKAEKIFQTLTLTKRPLPSGGLLTPKHKKLLPFQESQGVPFILAHSRSYLAHQPGLGKTAQAIVAVNTRPGRALIICPSFLKTVWAREITDWSIKDFPMIGVVPETAKQFDFDWRSYDFVICSDSMLIRAWVLKAIAGTSFRYCFIDEAHRFKTPEAARTIALFGGKFKKVQSPGVIYDIETVCALSGTPMLNKPIELWPILKAMAPWAINNMSYHNFGFKYCGAFTDDRGHWHFTGSCNESDLHQRLKPFMQRIRKDDVLKDLPDKVREVIVLDKDPRMQSQIIFDERLSKKIDLSQVEKLETLGEYAILRHINGLSKVPRAAKMVAEYLFNDKGESVLLFAHHKDVVAALYQALIFYKPRVINGLVKQSERTEIQDAFQAGTCRLIIGNIDAMNLGLTLTKATRIIFCEYAWTPALNEQAEDRAHRIGQKDSVFVQYLVLPRSLDEKILTALLKKQSSIEKVIDGL